MLKKSDLVKAQLEFALRITLFQDICEEGLDIKIYSYLRSSIEQAILYRKGRAYSRIEKKALELADVFERPGLAAVLLGVPAQFDKKVVTNAACGQSKHNYGLAVDCVPMKLRRAVWNDNILWDKIGFIAERCELEWGGDWKFKDKTHLQFPDLSWRDLIRLDKH